MGLVVKGGDFELPKDPDKRYASSEEGKLATTAVQPQDLNQVALTGNYDYLVNKPVILDTIEKFGGSELSLDNSPALTTALTAVGNHLSPWSDSRTAGEYTIVFPPGNYHFKTPVTIPTFTNVRIVANGAKFTCDQNYVFIRNAPNGVRYSFRVEGATFDTCGVEIKPKAYDTHFTNCHFHSAPHCGIWISATPIVGWDLAQEGGIGSAIKGSITDCWFYNCNIGIFCQGRQCTNWQVTRTEFAHNYGSDMKIYSDGWTIGPRVSIEQRRIGFTAEPHIHLAGRELSDITLFDIRFGPEVTPTHEPAKEAIFIGRRDTPETMASPNIRIFNCTGRGRAGGATATSANSFIRLNRATNVAKIHGNQIYGSYNNVIEFTHSKVNDGVRNKYYFNDTSGLPNFSRAPQPASSWEIT